MSSKLQAIIRMILSFVGAWLIGKNLGDVTIDPVIWQEILGALIALFSLIWGFIDKTVTEEKIASILRQVLTVVGGILVSAGFLKGAFLDASLSSLPIIVSIIWSFVTRSKAERLQDGEIQVAQLKK